MSKIEVIDVEPVSGVQFKDCGELFRCGGSVWRKLYNVQGNANVIDLEDGLAGIIMSGTLVTPVESIKLRAK